MSHGRQSGAPVPSIGLRGMHLSVMTCRTEGCSHWTIPVKKLVYCWVGSLPSRNGDMVCSSSVFSPEQRVPPLFPFAGVVRVTVVAVYCFLNGVNLGFNSDAQAIDAALGCVQCSSILFTGKVV